MLQNRTEVRELIISFQLRVHHLTVQHEVSSRIRGSCLHPHRVELQSLFGEDEERLNEIYLSFECIRICIGKRGINLATIDHIIRSKVEVLEFYAVNISCQLQC